jgi:Leucine-rich repeat (LRR) protein
VERAGAQPHSSSGAAGAELDQQPPVMLGPVAATSHGGCSKLKKISLMFSKVSDLALQGCVELQDLNFSFCSRLSSLEGLQTCTNLKMVDMSYTRVTSVEPLMACAQLEELRRYGLGEQLPGLAALTVALRSYVSRDVNRLCTRVGEALSASSSR